MGFRKCWQVPEVTASHARGSQKVLLAAAGHSWQCLLVVQINILALRDTIAPSFWPLTLLLSSFSRSDSRANRGVWRKLGK